MISESIFGVVMLWRKYFLSHEKTVTMVKQIPWFLMHGCVIGQVLLLFYDHSYCLQALSQVLMKNMDNMK